MTRYINQILGYEFKNHKGGGDTYTPIIDKPELITIPPVTKPLKTMEEREEEQSFFNCCHQIFIDCLNDQGNDQIAFSLKYLKEERGYNDEQIRNFKLGFFPDKNKFILLLTKAGYSQNKAEDLTTKYFTAILKINNYQKKKESKNRITFTWFDPDGNIIGFSVRKPTTNNELKPKYLNNNGLSKTEYLFNFTKDIADKELVIVERQLDALVGTYFAWQQEENSNYHFVAMGGSSISESQVNHFKKYSYSKVILLPDNDKNADDTETKPYTYPQFLMDIENSNDGLKTGFWELDQHVSIQPSSLTFIADAASKKVQELVDNRRLQIMTPKSSTESLSAAIIERYISCTKSKDTKPIAAVFIDYIQKLSTEEERTNRQQEVQRICQTLLTTTLDKRMAIPIILAGDIEQDANLVLGIWNEQAGELDDLLAQKAKSDINTEELDRRINKLKNPLPNTPINLQIKVLKNRNGQNNMLFKLDGYLDRYLIKNKDDKENYAKQAIETRTKTTN
ncbi:unnamed protein product [Rotaria magnacalcarata]|uniref:DNA primase DNAG catalytic core N-terminal domain-containing protein n=2 Tax=Rotaria magnacalcarata TaxID=392030 RepID=A0A818YZV5_9BILA|nr:unnamed protein product [Rotaria magnacalcarata]